MQVAPPVARRLILADSSGKAFTLQHVIRVSGNQPISTRVVMLTLSLTLIVAMNMCGSVLETNNIKEYLQHYFECKANSPQTTSALNFLPNWKHVGNPWRKYLRKMMLLRDFPRSSLPCLTEQETGQVRTRQVDYDAPTPRPSISALSTDATPRFQFAALLAGVPATALVDT